MSFLVIVFPGFALSCAIVMFVLGILQIYFYRTLQHNRSRDLALFCFFSGLFIFSNAVAQSRAFSPRMVVYFLDAFLPVIFLASIFYLKSMSYFISVPRWLKLGYYSGQISCAVISLFPIIYLSLFDSSIVFDQSNKVATGNYFMDSFTSRLGSPRTFPFVVVGLSSALNILMSVILLIRIQWSSRDTYLILGLVFTLTAAATKLMPTSMAIIFFVPIISMSNIFEALRMNFLVIAESKRQFRVRAHAQSEPSLALPPDDFENCSIDEERLNRLADKLIALLQDKSILRDPNLNMDRLSRELGTPGYILSQVLRFALNTNYSDFINKSRIDDVRLKMRDPKNKDKNLLDLAYSSGFNSKSAFNTAFKKFTDITPSQYRKQIQGSSGRTLDG